MLSKKALSRLSKAKLVEFLGLPPVEHIEQDGIFRFGRPLLENEKSPIVNKTC